LNRSIVRYFAVACLIVGIELIIFQVVYVINQNYVLGTIISFVFAVVLNWALSRRLVFGASSHSVAREFIYVSIVSIIGLAIQLTAVYLCVQRLHFYPLIGKVLSILTSFFWNYWFRAHFIFNTPKQDIGDKIEEIETSIY